LIDLHTHTNQSDGTLSPAELIQEAARIGLEAIAITDHDTFAGYDQAVPYAAHTSVELICGVELSTKHHFDMKNGGRSVHLLAYFLERPPSSKFREWVDGLSESRHQRNVALIEELRAKGMDISLGDVSARAGSIVGRPHFAAVMVDKGYVASEDQAFDEYLDEAACHIERAEPALEDAIHHIAEAGGFSVLPHPCRVGKHLLEESLEEMRGFGLCGIEVYHSDHTAKDCAYYHSLALRFGLAVSGGSDFHGAAKPEIALGTGIGGNVKIPKSILDDLKARASDMIDSKIKGGNL
jgi:3',5'-nucleoside bisphosphate phosphatase